MKRTLLPILAVLLLALGIYESRLRPAALARSLPTGTAEWIWSADVDAEDGWASFFVYRDFEVGAVVPTRAQLVVQADGGYWAFVNQHPVGSGGFREGAPADSYQVETFLRPGANRLLLQVRSRRGIGGVIANLDLGDSPGVVTDGRWKAFARYESAVLGPGFIPEDVVSTKVWGRPPIGAWPVSSQAAEIPLLADQLLPEQRARVTRIRPLGQRDWEKRFPSPDEHLPLGRWVVFDLGEVVHGYVNVAFASRAGVRGLIYTNRERPSGPDTADPAVWFAAPPGRGSWTDLQPRSFRFVTVLSLAELSGLRVFETDPGWVEARGAGQVRSRRAFSFTPPDSTATIEHEFWSELQRVTGLTGREAFERGPSG